MRGAKLAWPQAYRGDDDCAAVDVILATTYLVVLQLLDAIKEVTEGSTAWLASIKRSRNVTS